MVELLETTPQDRRQKMIDVGMQEDPDYTNRALEFMMTFEDVLKLPDMELAELTAIAPGRIIAMAIHPLDSQVKERFVRCSKPPQAAEIRSYFESPVGLRESGGAQLKLVQYARQLEKRGKISAKRIPL